VSFAVGAADEGGNRGFGCNHISTHRPDRILLAEMEAQVIEVIVSLLQHVLRPGRPGRIEVGFEVVDLEVCAGGRRDQAFGDGRPHLGIGLVTKVDWPARKLGQTPAGAVAGGGQFPEQFAPDAAGVAQFAEKERNTSFLGDAVLEPQPHRHAQVFRKAFDGVHRQPLLTERRRVRLVEYLQLGIFGQSAGRYGQDHLICLQIAAASADNTLGDEGRVRNGIGRGAVVASATDKNHRQETQDQNREE